MFWNWYVSVKVIIIYYFLFSGCHGGWIYRTLVRVKRGSGLNFIDLWNLSGYTCDEDAEYNLRNGVIDRSVTDNCLYSYHVKVPPKDFREYNNKNVSLYSWLTQNPFLSTYGWQDKSSIVRNDTNPKFMLHTTGNLDKFYLAVWQTTSSFSPFIFYSTSQASVPVTSLVSYINDNVGPVGFSETHEFRIIGKYHDNCAIEEPIGTIHKTMEECYAMISCPPTQHEINIPHVKEALYQESENHADHLPGSDVIWSFSARSLADCGLSCRSDLKCLSFFYNPSSTQCYGYKRPIAWTDSPKNNVGMKHYVNKNCKL